MTRACLMIAALLGLGAASVIAAAEVVAKPVPSRHGAVGLDNVLVYEASGTNRRPGVLLAHELGPASPAARAKAGQWARLGYVVLIADLEGRKDAGRHADETNARPAADARRALRRERLAAAQGLLEQAPQVDRKRVAAVGYGVGGTAVLDFARAKADLDGAVCVHGDVAPAAAAGEGGKGVGAPVLVVAGADDPEAPIAKIAAFEDEMRRGGVDWQLVRYGGVAGDFTNPLAGRNLKSGRAYDADADQRADAVVRAFLAETLAPAAKSTDAPKPPAGKPPAARSVAPGGTAKGAAKGAPEKVLAVLEHVDQTGEPKDGYEGGRSFGNFERRLPGTDAQGHRIKYREWDVNPLRPGVNRGAERLITGSDGSAHYTDDHYATFKKIR